MSTKAGISVRDGKFDVAVVAGPHVELFPSAGVRAFSALCAEMGLTVGLFGGETLNVRGVLPLAETGGLVVVEDVQHRVHRIEARAVVKVSSDSLMPDPFPGWRSQALIPLSTALRLRNESQVQWEPCTVILGSGNRALRFGSSLLESGARAVFCVESFAQWGAKRFAGWEVERRRFEMQGGRLIEARPVGLSARSPLLWELRLQDSHGIRVLEVARVVSVGPFRDGPGFREYPLGSFLFELDQSAPERKADDVEGWVLEEERGRFLAGKIVRALVSDFSAQGGPRREALDRIFNRARGRTKRYLRHREQPFAPVYQGKWIAPASLRQMKSFRGIPQSEHKKRLVASIECFEEIPCNVCQTACPTGAIQIGHVPRTRDTLLTEALCTACGICVAACPSQAVSMIQENDERNFSLLTLPWKGSRPWTVGEFATLLNRRAETLGSARVVNVDVVLQTVQVEVPTHLLWEARELRYVKPSSSAEDDIFLASVSRETRAEAKVEITLNGEKRLVRDRVPVSTALFETGQSDADDVLFCPDGSCGLCQVDIDGVRKLACQSIIHRGMSVRIPAIQEAPADVLCPCLGITREQVIERLKQGKLQSPEAVISVLHVGEGKCHGQLCMGAFKRVLEEQGIPTTQWIDWRFPWTEWVLTRS